MIYQKRIFLRVKILRKHENLKMIYQKQYIFVSLRVELFCHAQVAREHLKMISLKMI
jgi:hypothetical protein